MQREMTRDEMRERNMMDDDHSGHPRRYTVGEVSEGTGLTRQRLRQLCEESVAAGSEDCMKIGGIWSISAEFFGRLLIKRTERELSRSRKAGDPSDANVRLLAESALKLAEALDRRDDDLRQTIEELRAENAKLKRYIREWEDQDTRVRSSPPKSDGEEIFADPESASFRSDSVGREQSEGTLHDQKPGDAPPGNGGRSRLPDGVRKRRSPDPQHFSESPPPQAPRDRHLDDLFHFPEIDSTPPLRDPRDRSRKMRLPPGRPA